MVLESLWNSKESEGTMWWGLETRQACFLEEEAEPLEP